MIKRCLTIINTKSGAKEGRTMFASALQQILHGSGITHFPVCVPERNLLPYIEAHSAYDAVVVCGGDGTISSVINCMAASEQHEALLAKPLIIVPCGTQNSIAASLAITSSDTSISAFVTGRPVTVPVWEVMVNKTETARYVVSHVAVGAYAETVRRAHAMEEAMDEYWTLPNIRSKFKFASMYTTALAETFDVSIELERRGAPGGGEDAAAASWELIKGPIKSLVAAQLAMQHRGYSLTPHASPQHGLLAVMVADASAARSRMWHLSSREATRVDLGILNEDGVKEVTGISALRITVGPSAPCLMLLDGERLVLDPGTVVDVRRVKKLNATFLCP